MKTIFTHIISTKLMKFVKNITNSKFQIVSETIESIPSSNACFKLGNSTLIRTRLSGRMNRALYMPVAFMKRRHK